MFSDIDWVPVPNDPPSRISGRVDVVRADVVDIPALTAAAAAENSLPIPAPAADEWVREWAG
jgi:hypothetical protein